MRLVALLGFCIAASVAFLASHASEPELSFVPLRGQVPTAPHDTADARNKPLCRGDARNPETPEDKAVVHAGWLLISAAQQTGSTRVAVAASSMDGQCEPQDFKVFVFHQGKLVGQVNARDKQAMPTPIVRDEKTLLVSVDFHKPSDAHCCASGHETLTVDIPNKQQR